MRAAARRALMEVCPQFPRKELEALSPRAMRSPRNLRETSMGRFFPRSKTSGIRIDDAKLRIAAVSIKSRNETGPVFRPDPFVFAAVGSLD